MDIIKSKKLFHHIKIKKDNACFYRAISYFLYYYSNLLEQPNRIIKLLHHNKWLITNQSTLLNRTLINDDILPELLQYTIMNWIIQNSQYYLPELDYHIFDLLLDTHFPEYSNITKRLQKKSILLEYKNRYSIYAANNNKDNPDRWGGLIDCYAINKLFHLSIEIYQNYDTHHYKLIQKIGYKEPNITLYYDGNHYNVLVAK